jgi:UDP-glucose 4-epimerase
MRVLITGGAGFIGSHLADHYVNAGCTVILLDNFSTGSKTNIAHLEGKVSTVDGDIRNIELVEKLTKETDLVLHMAAALGVNTILESPLESMSTNITGSEVVLNAAAKHNKRIIIASTSEIYGKNPKQPLSETDDRVVGAPQKIRWTYSDAKAIEEAMAFALHQEKKLPVTTVRLFNTVGPRQTGRYGMVVPRFVQAALKNEAITIYGDGAQSRVFCHVADAVEAIAKIAESDSTIGDVYNVGGTGEVTIKQLAVRVLEITGSTSEITYTPYSDAYPAGFEDIQRRVPDISKIKSAINWAPTKDLKQIISDIAEL